MSSTDEFLRLLDPDPERARVKYERLFTRLVKFFEWRQCESPEDLAQETILRVMSKVDSGTSLVRDDNTAYFFKAAGFVLLETRKRKRPTAVLDEEMSAGLIELRTIEARIALKECLDFLEPEERRFFVRYYTEDREALRAELCLSSVAMRVRAYRLKQRILTTVHESAGTRSR